MKNRKKTKKTHAEKGDPIIDLRSLTEQEKKFWQHAKERFEANIKWIDFEELVFGTASPIYENCVSHLEVMETPLYLALEKLWIELGIRQGHIKKSNFGKNVRILE